MAEWVKKFEDKARGLIAEAEQELTVLEGVDTVDLTTDGSEADEPTTATDDK